MLFVSLILQSDETETLAKDVPETTLAFSELGSQSKARAPTSPPAVGMMTSIWGGDVDAAGKAPPFSLSTTEEA